LTVQRFASHASKKIKAIPPKSTTIQRTRDARLAALGLDSLCCATAGSTAGGCTVAWYCSFGFGIVGDQDGLLANGTLDSIAKAIIRYTLLMTTGRAAGVGVHGAFLRH
jgi:hypothetical protein